MPYAVHDLEGAVSALAESSRRAVAGPAEWVRQVLDLEHWPAFGASFDALTVLLSQIADGDTPPRSISVLSGDVHHSYVARADLAGTPIHQLTCSPVHNRVPPALRAVFRVAWRPGATRIGRAIRRTAGLAPTRVRWTKLAGPYFGTAIGTIVHSGQSALVTIDGTAPDGRLVEVARVPLAEPATGAPPESDPARDAAGQAGSG
jgi:hypothetical protein